MHENEIFHNLVYIQELSLAGLKPRMQSIYGYSYSYSTIGAKRVRCTLQDRGSSSSEGPITRLLCPPAFCAQFMPLKISNLNVKASNLYFSFFQKPFETSKIHIVFSDSLEISLFRLR